MSTTTEADLRPLSGDRPAARPRTGPHPSWAGIASGLLLWTTFPPAEWGWLAWCALVPLLLLVVSGERSWKLYLGAWAGGLVFWIPTLRWVSLTDPTAWLAWVVMALALSFFWPLFLFLTRWSVRRHRLPLMIAAPVAWVALEYIRAYIVTGFPWYYLAHTQHRFLTLIQIADVTGSLGLSLAVMLVNAWIVDLLTLPLARPTPRGVRLAPGQALRLGVVASMLVGLLGYGTFRLRTAQFREGPTIALLQSNLPQRLKMGGDPNAILATYRSLVERAARDANKPFLIVWPETSFPFSHAIIAPGLDDGELDRQLQRHDVGMSAASWRDRAGRVGGALRSLADQTGIPMLVGAIAYDHRASGSARYNAALLYEPATPAERYYYKMHLVPFGEFVPLIDMFPWLAALTPYDPDHVPSLGFGPGPVWFDLGPYRLATAICFEDTVPQVVRRFFAEVPDGRPPDILLNLSNDGWFVDQRADGSLRRSHEHEVHLAASIFRAIEHRAPLARSANTGISAIVDGNGQVVKQLESLKEGVVAGAVPLDDRQALYTRWGDWVGQGCLAVTVGLLGLGLSRRSPKPTRG